MVKLEGMKIRSLIEAYNKYARLKYRRKYWRDLTIKEVMAYPALRDTVFEWANQEKTNFHLEKLAKPSQQSSLKILPKKDVNTIVAWLMGGSLVIIPNGKIYVIFGIDDEHASHQVTRKINNEKLRHPLLPIVQLSSVNKVPSNSVKNNKIRVFLKKLVVHFQPIGLLLPNDKPKSTSLYVFYGGEFFETLIRRINEESRARVFIYVSSANITTTGANTTLEGVINDFSSSKNIVGVVDGGDLKKQSIDNNSSTIVQCSVDGELAYYRLGYPPKEQIDFFAAKHGIKINDLPGTRETNVR